MRCGTPEAYKLMHDGALAFSEIEANGMKIDEDYLHRAIRKVGKRIERLENELKQDPLWKKWRKRFGSKAKITAREQFGTILYAEGILKKEDVKATRTGKISTDKADLSKIDHPFVKAHQQIEELRKLKSTYLTGILREADPDGFVHTSFNLHTTLTYRSSSDRPNLQNIPIRNPEIASWIRRAFIPRKPNRCIVEIDYSGIEVRVSACYNKDPVLIKYIKDPTTDMHRDMASQIYICDPDKVSKDARYCAKNMFVFPEFYGSFFANCAPNLWEAIARMKLAVGDIPMEKWLRKKGITGLGEKVSDWDSGRILTEQGTFMEHVRQVEHDFWNNRFGVYTEWKDSWYEKYLRKGYFRSYTGFIYSSILGKREVCNYPIQGSAFHCLLQATILIMKQIKKQKLDALPICEIHDSLISDVHVNDVPAYVEMAIEVMTKTIPAMWDWIIVPLDAEVEVATQGESWSEKSVYKI